MKKLKLISKFMTAIHILPTISKSKGNQMMNFFGQLIECNMRNIFFEKSYATFSVEASPRPFGEKSKRLSIIRNCLRHQEWKFNLIKLSTLLIKKGIHKPNSRTTFLVVLALWQYYGLIYIKCLQGKSDFSFLYLAPSIIFQKNKKNHHHKQTTHLLTTEKTNYDDIMIKLEMQIHTLKDKTFIFMKKINETNSIN